MNKRAALSSGLVGLVGLFCAGAMLLAPGKTQADPPLPGSMWHSCKPVESMIWFGSRYHIRCDSPMWVGSYRDVPISYFAISDSNAAQVQQAMSLVNAAITSGKSVSIHAMTGSSTNPPGCLSGDCRLFDAVMLLAQ